MASKINIGKAVNDALKTRALSVAGSRMIRDAVIVEPRPPLETGMLRGSGSVFVDTERVSDSRAIGFNGGEPPQSNDIPQKDTVTLVFDTPYAARMDQFLEPLGNLKSRFTQDPKIGGGWMSKLTQKKFTDIYVKLIGNTIKKGLDNKGK